MKLVITSYYKSLHLLLKRSPSTVTHCFDQWTTPHPPILGTTQDWRLHWQCSTVSSCKHATYTQKPLHQKNWMKSYTYIGGGLQQTLAQKDVNWTLVKSSDKIRIIRIIIMCFSVLHITLLELNLKLKVLQHIFSLFIKRLLA